MGALETNTTLIYGVHIRESATDGSDFTNAAADYRVLFLGEDGLLHVKDSSGTVTSPYSSSAPTRAGCLIYHNTTQVVNNSFVLFNSEVNDAGGYHDTVTNTDRITIPTGGAGLYVIEYGGNVASLAAGEFLRVNLNNTSNISTNVGGTAAVVSGYLSDSFTYPLADADYIRLNFTGNRTLGHASAYEAQMHFSAYKISA